MTADHKEGEQLEDRRNVGEKSYNFGDGTDQSFQSLMFMIIIIIIIIITINLFYFPITYKKNFFIRQKSWVFLM
jgi:hypothetical protein